MCAVNAETTSKTLRAGFPTVVLGVSSSGSNIPANHAPAVGTPASFGVCTDFVDPTPAPSFVWSTAAASRGRLFCATEADVGYHVRNALQEVITALRLPLSIFMEVEVASVRPDIYVIRTASGLPVGTVEVKKPGHLAMTHERILGEVFDQMMHLRQVFGVCNTVCV